MIGSRGPIGGAIRYPHHDGGTEQGFILPMVLAALALGSLVVFSLLSFTSTSARAGGEDTDNVLALYAAQSALTDVVTDLLEGSDALAGAYVVPSPTVNDLDVAVSVVPPVPIAVPEPPYQYIDPGAGFGLGSLGSQSHYYFRIDSVYAGSALRLNWDFSPPGQRWKMAVYEGSGPPGAPAAVSIADDDLESGGLSGGTGWEGGWDVQGNVDVVSTEDPFQGTYHLRLRQANGRAKRAVDTSAESDLKLRFRAKADSFEAGETATLSVSTDDVTYVVVRTWEDGEDDGVYRAEDIDLTPYGTSTSFWIAFEANVSGPGDRFFVDVVEVVTQPLSAPIAASSDTKGPGSLLVDGSLVTGGAYTIDFFNDSGPIWSPARLERAATARRGPTPRPRRTILSPPRPGTPP